LEHAIGLGQRRRTGLLGVPEVPEHAAADNRGQVRFGGETMGVLFIGQEIDRESEPTSGEHRDQPLVTQGAYQAIERHRREMVENCAPLQTEAPVGGQQRITGHCGPHLAVTQDEMRQDREHRLARRTLDAPDRESAQPDTDVVRVACQAAAAGTSRLVFQLKAKRQEEGEYKLEKRLAITKQLKVGGFVLEIDGDRPIFAGLASLFGHGSPSRH
jgi:hypothetical protein